MSLVRFVVRSLLWTGIQPTLDASTETLCRSNVQAKCEEKIGIGWCMRAYA